MTSPEQVELTPRQQQILQLLQAGKVNKEVARELDIGLGTVKQHIVAIFRKLNVRNRTAAAFHHFEAQAPDATETLTRTPRILLSARPCVVLAVALPPNSDHTVVRQLYAYMGSLSTSYDAIFVTRQGNAGELIFGIQRVTEYDSALALHLAHKIYESITTNFPDMQGQLRGCMTAGLGFASMQRFGGWSGEAIASAAISGARDLLQTTTAGLFTFDQAVLDLFESFGISSTLDISDSLPFEALSSMRWSGQRGLHPMVGRSQELKILQTALSRAKTGKGSIVIVEGEMGMGKSRICHAVQELATAKLLKVQVYRGLPAILGAGLLDVTKGTPCDTQSSLAAITNCSRRSFNVIVLDDFHLLESQQKTAWLDAANKARADGLMIVFSGRKGFAKAAPPDSVHMPLTRLPVTHMQALIRQALKMPSGKKRGAIMHSIVETSTGVPLFALEMARMPDPVKLPLPLLVAVQSRIDTFQLDSSILRLIASNEKPISIDRVAETLGESPELLQVQIERACATGVITRQSDGALEFSHPMIRRVIANSIMD